jgi:poly-gamma-glutamate capsule biosynthesis protein CapA/YwtB (metallophosphatase superfamily)
VLRSADLVVGNQEAPITTSNEPVGGKICLKSHPESAGVLRKWGVDVVSLANNHTFDYGWEGFEQTRWALDDAGVAYLGAGKDLAEASRPLIVDVKGLRLGFLAYSWAQVQTRCATEDSFGCAPLDDEFMIRGVRDLAERVDAVIVMPHWGFCDYTFPTPEQVHLGRRLLDAGVAAVVGHHSHVVQGLVRTSGRLVAYSLGNFAFAPCSDRGRPVDRTQESFQGAVLTVGLSRGHVESCDITHTINTNGSIDIDAEARRAKAFALCCKPLTASDYAKHWRRVVRRRMLARGLYWMNVRNWRKIRWRTLSGGWLMLKMVLSGQRTSS